MTAALVLRVWGPIALETLLVAAFVVLTNAPTGTPGAASLLSVAVGIAAGAGIFALIAREPPRLRLPRTRRGIVATKASVLLLRSTFEEILWRGVVLGALAERTGVILAYAASTIGFAGLHAGPHARQIHLVSGASFGGLYLATHGLGAPIAAHATYNLLVLLAAESGRLGNPPRASPGTQAPTLPVRLREATKRFGAIEALRGVTLDVRDGEVLALLGRNGAGKTTAVDLVLGLRRPDAGAVRVFGMDPRIRASRLQVGATPQESMFPGTLRVREIATFAAAHFADHEPVEHHLERFGMGALVRRQVGGLSPGERRRLALALAFVGRPRLVVLDEPTTGLDVGSRRTAWDAVRAHSQQGGTVLLTTHSLEEVDALASRIAVLSEGRIVATGTPETLVAELALKRVRLRASSVPELPAVERAIHERGIWELATRDAEGTVARLVEAGVRREEIEIAPASLEDAFLALTEGSEE